MSSYDLVMAIARGNALDIEEQFNNVMYEKIYERLHEMHRKTSKNMFKEEDDELNEKKWIAGAIKHPGALHKQLHVPADKNIPVNKLEAAAKKGGTLAKRANLAMTLRKLRK